MEQQAVSRYIAGTLAGVAVVEMDGNAFFFYDPDGENPENRRFPFATLVANDLYDQFSNLNREGVYRLNVGVSRQTYQGLFGAAPDPTDAAASTYDVTALDTIMPHPVYGQMFWVCVLSPSSATFERVKLLLAEAHARAVRAHQGRSPDHA